MGWMGKAAVACLCVATAPASAQECQSATDYYRGVSEVRTSTLSAAIAAGANVVTDEDLGPVDAAIDTGTTRLVASHVPCNADQEAFAVAVLDYLTAYKLWWGCYPLYVQAVNVGDVGAWLACVQPVNLLLLTANTEIANTSFALLTNAAPPDPDYVPPVGWGGGSGEEPPPPRDPTPAELLATAQEAERVLTDLVHVYGSVRKVAGRARAVAIEAAFSRGGVVQVGVDILESRQQQYVRLLRGEAQVAANAAIQVALDPAPGGMSALRGSSAVPEESPVHREQILGQITITHVPDDGGETQTLTLPTTFPVEP